MLNTAGCPSISLTATLACPTMTNPLERSLRATSGSVYLMVEVVSWLVLTVLEQYLHDISKFNLLLSKLLLVFLQPGLVVLDKEVDGVT